MNHNKDSRTDNWAGHRDPASNPNNYKFPRSAREAGFYYGSVKPDNNSTDIIIVLLLILGIILWAA